MNIGFKMRQNKFNNQNFTEHFPYVFSTLLALTTFGGALIEESLRNVLLPALLNNERTSRLDEYAENLLEKTGNALTLLQKITGKEQVFCW